MTDMTPAMWIITGAAIISIVILYWNLVSLVNVIEQEQDKQKKRTPV